MKIETIANLVFETYQTNYVEVFCKTRKQDKLFLRYIIYKIASDMLFDGHGAAYLGRYGHQNRTSVIAALKEANNLLEQRNGFSKRYRVILNALKYDKGYDLRQQRKELLRQVAEINKRLETLENA